MQQLTEQGRQRIDELAQRYSVSTDAVMTLLQSLVNSNGTMAQFNHRELGGGGQWMRGGMTMVGAVGRAEALPRQCLRAERAGTTRLPCRKMVAPSPSKCFLKAIPSSVARRTSASARLPSSRLLLANTASVRDRRRKNGVRRERRSLMRNRPTGTILGSVKGISKCCCKSLTEQVIGRGPILWLTFPASWRILLSVCCPINRSVNTAEAFLVGF